MDTAAMLNVGLKIMKEKIKRKINKHVTVLSQKKFLKLFVTQVLSLYLNNPELIGHELNFELNLLHQIGPDSTYQT